MSGVSEAELVDLLTEIIARETVNPPGNEDALAEYFVDRFEASPVAFDVELQEVHPGRPNVVARAGDPAKGRLLLTGHMDVVPASPDDWSGDPFELQRENDRLIGRGTADMKGALAAKLVAAEAFLTEYDDTGRLMEAVDAERYPPTIATREGYDASVVHSSRDGGPIGMSPRSTAGTKSHA